MGKKQQHIKPLPFFVYFWTTVAIALTGLADALYLALSHYWVYVDMGYKSFCAVSKAINCDTVSQSSFSIFLHVPVSVWGMVGYLIVLSILLVIGGLDEKRTRLWPTLTFIAFCYSIYSIVLAFLSTFYIRSYCIMCIASYAVNLLLVYFSWLTYNRFNNKSIFIGLKNDLHWLVEHKTFSMISLSVLAVVFIVLVAFFPSYWEFKTAPLSENIPTGTTVDGHPWIGAENAQITITEFTDYRCFQCKKMHFYLRQLIANYPGKIRLVHRNFPMDHIYNPMVKEPFHVGSGKMALFALYAVEKGFFWKINDMLFNLDTRKGYFNIKEMAKTGGFDLMDFAGAINDRTLRYRLAVDIRDGMKLGISGTPAYMIDGEVYIGYVPTNIFEVIME